MADLIPIKCVSCGRVISSKFEYYKRKVSQMKQNPKAVEYLDFEKIQNLSDDVSKHKTPEGKVLDELGLNDPCCRRHFITFIE